MDKGAGSPAESVRGLIRKATAHPASGPGVLALLTAAYIVVAKIGLSVASVHPSASAVWPPTGLALASLLLLGNRVWPAVFAGAFLANLTTAGSIATSVSIALGNTLEALLSVYLVKRWAGGRNVLDRPRSIVQLAAIAGLSATVSATVGVTSLSIAGFARWAQFEAIWKTWWLGNLGGVLVVAPLILAGCSRPAFGWNRMRRLEAIALLLAIVLVPMLVFGGWASLPSSDYPITFICIPIMLWAAFRFHQQGAAIAVFGVTIAAIVGTLGGHGPFVLAYPNDALLLIQMFVAVMSVTSLVIAASVSERGSLEDALRDAYEDLGLRFERQKADLARAITSLRSEIAARTVAERYARLTIETTPGPILLLDARLRVKAANPAFCSAFRIARRKIENRLLDELSCHEWASPELRRLLDEVASRGTRHDGIEFQLDVPETGRRTFRLWARRVEQDRPPDQLVILSLEDVTEYREADEALRASEARFRAVAESAIDGILCANHRGEIVYANRAAKRLLGYSADALVGRPLTVLIPERFHDRHRHGFAHHLTSGETRIIGKTVELTARHESGTEVPVELSLTSWNTGEQKMFAAVMRDISQRKAAERETLRLNAELEERVLLRTQDLERSNRELERFAFIAAHDLQEPLRTVTGYAQLLARRYAGKLDGRADEMIDMVVGGASWMHMLINDLLAYLRLGTMTIHLDNVDCESVLERAVANLERAIRESQAKVTHDPLPAVVADEPQLVLVFQNLIGNALKFHGPEAPRVHWRARQVGANWEITVRDNGIGIKQDNLKGIFNVFERLHTREEYPGTGIGLAICRRTLERLGGSIWAESEPGGGSTFHIVLSGATMVVPQPVEIGAG